MYSQQSTNPSAPSTPSSCLNAEEKQLPGATQVRIPGPLWLSEPEDQSLLLLQLTCKLNLAFCLPSVASAIIHTPLQLKRRPALCPVPGLALMTTYRGCLLASLVSHQPSSITLHSVSSACHASFLCLLVLSHQSPKIQAISHTFSEALANHLRPK